MRKKFNISNWEDQICQQIGIIHLIAKYITLQYVFAKTFLEGQKKTVIIELSSCNAHTCMYLTIPIINTIGPDRLCLLQKIAARYYLISSYHLELVVSENS